ncbi:hypothetical protein OZK63_13600 [Streptomyces sp. UMAF16]|nr:hypothetical protein [Streptomyces sp. UMAF16]
MSKNRPDSGWAALPRAKAHQGCLFAWRSSRRSQRSVHSHRGRK